MDGLNGHRSQSSASSRCSRPPTVDEALQYTPLTSIIPFDAGIIPIPSAAGSGLSSTLLTSEESFGASKAIDTLNKAARKPRNTSAHLEQTLKDLQHLLKADDLPQYHFAPPAAVYAQVHEDSTQKNRGENSVVDAVQSRLGAFAEVVMDSVDVSYRYPTPISPDLSCPSEACAGSVDDRRATTSFPHHASPKSIMVAEESARGQSLMGNDLARPSEPKILRCPTVIIPSPSDPSYAARYQKYTTEHAGVIHSTGSPSRKRKREDGRHHLLGTSAGQQEHGQAALRQLRALLANVFEAEDRLEPDTSGMFSTSTTKYFVSSGLEGSDEMVVAPDVQTEVETAIAKVIASNKFADVPVEYVERLQRLSNRTLDSMQGIDLTSFTTADKLSLEHCVSRITAADNSLRASRTLLTIMTAGREEKQLFSEEALLLVLQNLKHNFENLLIPLVEMKAVFLENDVFKANSGLRALVATYSQRAGKLLKLVGDLLLKVDLSESSTALVEDLSLKLIFLENASSEKDCLIGLQKLEAIRRHAMDVITNLFLRHPAHRQIILNEILSSLEKLPATRQSARQFKATDGKPIQLVSALIMRLVQTSAVHVSQLQPEKAATVRSNGDDEETFIEDVLTPRKPKRRAATEQTDRLADGSDVFCQLWKAAKPLIEGVEQNAAYVVQYLVQRALKSTKTGDQPFRNLLDLFTEDFVSVLESVNWPAAEVLLRSLLASLVTIMRNDKSAAPAKVMALELLGLMASSIANLQGCVEQFTGKSEGQVTSLDEQIYGLSLQALEGRVSDVELFAPDGPYRMILDFTVQHDASDLQLKSAYSYQLLQWARGIWQTFGVDTAQLKDVNHDGSTAGLSATASSLEQIILGSARSMEGPKFESLSTLQARQCHAITVLSMPFGRALPLIFSILLSSFTSPQATIKSKGLRSLVQLLEREPAILERSKTVIAHIHQCVSDPSTMVRDSALDLIGKCMSVRPNLENEFLKVLIAKTSDTATGIRKRALKLLKDIYLRNTQEDARAFIANALLQRLHDPEESISQLARSILEEIWITAFHGIIDTVKPRTDSLRDLQAHIGLLVAVIQRGENSMSVLEEFFKSVLHDETKASNANKQVCKTLVAVVVDNIIDNAAEMGNPSQQSLFQTLTVFARAKPDLFDGNQMVTLRPYIKNLSNDDNILIYRSVVTIYRYVLPILPPLQHGFLAEVQSSLLTSITKVGRLELDEVATCLSIIDGVLKNTDRLVKLLTSVLLSIEDARTTTWSSTSPPALFNRCKRLIMIAGFFGKACNLDAHKALFQEKFPWWRGESVAGLAVDIIRPFTYQQESVAIREIALESICLICQSWPKNFLKQEVIAAFDTVFAQETGDRLELAVLKGFRTFFSLEEERSKSNPETPLGDESQKGMERLATSMVQSDNDGVSTTISQHFLSHVLRIALASTGERARVATEIIVSTNRQGLTHPRACGIALIALETSQDPVVATMAFNEHRNLHHKHESMMEKDYLKAVEHAFHYQKVIGDDRDGFDKSLSPKLGLFFEVLKSGGIVSRKKFLKNLVIKITCDLHRKLSIEDLENTLQYAMFVLHNLALFDYPRVEEIIQLISHMEKQFATVGNSVSQQIELMLQLDQQQTAQKGITEASVEIEFDELRRLTIAATILSTLWDTRSHLCRAWGLPPMQNNKVKTAAKDNNRAAVRTINAEPSSYLNKTASATTSLNSTDDMIARCKAFIELLSVDTEVTLNSEEEAKGYETLTEVTDDLPALQLPASGGAKSVKGRRSSSVGHTPRKPKMTKRPSMAGRRTSKRKASDDDEDGEWD